MTCIVQEGDTTDRRAKARRRHIWSFSTPCRQPCLNSSLAKGIPWRAVWACVLSLSGACVGTWLLFQQFQTALGPRCSSGAVHLISDVPVVSMFSR